MTGKFAMFHPEYGILIEKVGFWSGNAFEYTKDKINVKGEHMTKFVANYLMKYEINEELSYTISNIASALIILLISALAYLVTRKIIVRILETFVAKTHSTWGMILVENKVLERVSAIVPVFVIHAFAPVFPAFSVWIQRLAFCAFVLVILLTIDKLLNTVDEIYRNYEVSKERPIKGYLQVLEIIAYVIGVIIIISTLIERSPLLLLSGIGAATAVLLLIFQNSILGFVAGIQLTANNMVKLGDWIEMPKYGADGTVMEISLHTVKIQNGDKTITTIPTNALVTESFKNWRGMQESGGRRIKRAIYIDMTSIRFCDEEMLNRYRKIHYIHRYIDDKITEIEAYNQSMKMDLTDIVNGRHLTNIGTFRAYVDSYLANHPKVHKGMTMLVRQLDPTEKGLPVEIYAFINETAWADFEAIQADLFDHILAVVPEFDLRIFQNPTGHDLRRLHNGADN